MQTLSLHFISYFISPLSFPPKGLTQMAARIPPDDDPRQRCSSIGARWRRRWAPPPYPSTPAGSPWSGAPLPWPVLPRLPHGSGDAHGAWRWCAPLPCRPGGSLAPRRPGHEDHDGAARHARKRPGTGVARDARTNPSVSRALTTHTNSSSGVEERRRRLPSSADCIVGGGSASPSHFWWEHPRRWHPQLLPAAATSALPPPPPMRAVAPGPSRACR